MEDFELVPVPAPGNGGVMSGGKMTSDQLRSMKGRRPIGALTAYDFPAARILDEAGVALILVGDSLGMTVLGYPDTTRVTMEDMEHHLRAAARAKPRALLAADLPYGSVETPEDAVRNARRLQAAGAEAVKAEGGSDIAPQIRAIVRENIPFIAHLGMLPQRAPAEGGYRVKGKTGEERRRLLEEARAVEDAGAFAVVLELVEPEVAAEMTRSISIPTLGIGSGKACDGQILVSHDLFGLFPWFRPKFVQPRMRAADEMRQAVKDWLASLSTQG